MTSNLIAALNALPVTTERDAHIAALNGIANRKLAGADARRAMTAAYAYHKAARANFGRFAF